MDSSVWRSYLTSTFVFSFSLQWQIRNRPTCPSRRWSSSMGPLPSSKGHSGRWSSCGRSTASTPTKLVLSLSPSAPHSPVSTPSCLTPLLLKDCPEFDLMFENAFDQWVAGSAGEKCTFIQVLHHTCQRYSSARKPEFINCQSKLLGGKTIEANAANAANAKRRRCCPFGARWLCHARLAAVAMCCEPVSLCAMVPGDTWYTRGSMNITQAARQPSAGQCNTSCSPRIYIAHFKLKLPLIINLP